MKCINWFSKHMKQRYEVLVLSKSRSITEFYMDNKQALKYGKKNWILMLSKLQATFAKYTFKS